MVIFFDYLINTQLMEEPFVPTPPNVDLRRDNGNLVLIRKWWNIKFIFLTFFVIAWDSFLFFWYSIAFGGSMGGPMNWLMIVFPVLHVAVGIGLTYYTIAGYLNSTIMVVGQGSLSVTHDPMWWPGNKSYQSDMIDQVYIKRDENKSTDDEGRTSTSVTYSVWLIYKNNKSVELIDNLEDKQEALYFEHILEKELRIEDKPVQGEAKNRSRDGFIS